MNSPSRAVRIRLLTLSMVVMLAAWSGAAAQTNQTGDTDETGAAVRRVCLAGPTDDPDPVPWGLKNLKSTDALIVGQSQEQSGIVRLAIAFNLYSCLPSTTWTPCGAAGLDMAVSAVASRQASARAAQGAPSVGGAVRR